MVVRHHIESCPAFAAFGGQGGGLPKGLSREQGGRDGVLTGEQGNFDGALARELGESCGVATFVQGEFDGAPARELGEPCGESPLEQGDTGKKRKGSAFDRIVELSAVRDRSSQELAERMAQEGYADNDVASALARAREYRIVDDMRFAEAFIRGRVSAGKGTYAIQRDLLKHGIDLESVPGWPDDFDMADDGQYERALQYLASHPPRAKDVKASAYRKLVSKGYPSAIASQAAWEYCKGLG